MLQQSDIFNIRVITFNEISCFIMVQLLVDFRLGIYIKSGNELDFMHM